MKCFTVIFAVIILAANINPLYAGERTQAEIFLSPDGKDSNRGTKDAPLATLEMARNRVREILGSGRMTGNIIVHVAPGTYRLTKPVKFTEEDSGQNNYRVIYRCSGAPGTAMFTGGQLLTGWKRHTDRIWKIELPGDTIFHTLYENGKRVYKARTPNRKYYPKHATAAALYFTSVKGSLRLEKGAKESWIITRKSEVDLSAIDIRQLRINIFPWGKCDWQRYICKVTKVDSETGKIAYDNDDDLTEVKDRARYFLEDAMVFLDAPGEFFLDEKARILFYIPLEKKHPDQLAITAPILHDLIRITGKDRESTVRNILFDGLRFDTTDGMSPRNTWWRYFRKGTIHALVFMQNTEKIEFRNCHFKNSGTTGLFMSHHNVHNIVAGCLIEQMGVNGITLCNWSGSDSAGKSPNNDRLEFNILTNNKIHDVGQLMIYCSCINLMCGSYNRISYSELYNSPRYAITMRGNVQGQYGPFKINANVPPSVKNTFEYLNVYECGHDSGDMGAVHTATLNIPNGPAVNTFRQITIDRVYAVPGMMDYPPNGIFIDWPSRSMHQVFENMLITNTQGKPFRSHGNDNETSAVYRNVSWKPGFDKSAVELNRIGLLPSFPKEYGGRGIPVPSGAPQIKASQCTEHSVTLIIENYSPEIVYTLFRNSKAIGTFRNPEFTDTGLSEKTVYKYEIKASSLSDSGPDIPDAEHTVTTLADTKAPEFAADAVAVDSRTILLHFNEAVDKASAEKTDHFSLHPRRTITRSRVCPDPRFVRLDMEPGSLPETAQVTAVNIKDCSAASNKISRPISCRIISISPMLRYTFDNEKADSGMVSDSGPKALHGKLNGGSVLHALPGGNTVLKLDGKDGYVLCAAAANLPDRDFTMCVWIKKASQGSRIVMAKGNGFMQNEWSLGWVWPGNAENISFRAENRFVCSQPKSLPINQWIHTAVVRKGTSIRIFLNGQLSNEFRGFAPKSWQNDKPLMLGRRELAKTPAWFHGMIDDVLLTNKALTEEQLRAFSQLRPE
jgi:hypothetical protein